MRDLTRRTLLKIGAGAVVGIGGADLLSSCGSGGAATPVASVPAAPSPTPAPVTCTAPAEARVAAAQGMNLGEMTRSALDALGGIGSVVRAGETVFIKPNMVTLPWAGPTYDPFRLGECTKPEIVIAVVEECLKAGASRVIVGDGSQMPRFDWSGATTLDGSTNLRLEASALARRYSSRVDLACLDVDTPEWVEVPVGTSLGRVAVSSLVMQADRVISIAVAKTHKWAYLTLSLKNFIGITPLERYGWTNTPDGNTRVGLHANDPGASSGFGRLFVDIARAAHPDLALVDMSIGIEGNGPSLSTGGITADMRQRHGSWVVLAGTDPVAVDATAARVLGLEQPFVGSILSMAEAAGMGTACEQSIRILGGALDELRVSWRRADVAVP